MFDSVSCIVQSDGIMNSDQCLSIFLEQLNLSEAWVPVLKRVEVKPLSLFGKPVLNAANCFVYVLETVSLLFKRDFRDSETVRTMCGQLFTLPVCFVEQVRDACFRSIACRSQSSSGNSFEDWRLTSALVI